MLKRFCMVCIMTALILCAVPPSWTLSQEPTERVNIEQECADCFVRFPYVQSQRDSVQGVAVKETAKKKTWRIVAIVESVLVLILIIRG